ncbi:hypothetical protein DRQ36_05825 [bacterium]|nr:MAG: hypothetical protein DRQ36_05825 [bacterium]
MIFDFCITKGRKLITIWNIFLTFFLVAFWPILVLWALIGKHRLSERLGSFPKCPAGTIWIHAASVGEAGVAVIIRDFIELIEPHRPVIFTAATKTGVSRLKKIAGPNDRVAALPADYPIFISRAFDRVKPAAVIIVETEFWPNFLLGAKNRNIPIILTNGKISDATLSWARRFPKTFAKIADSISHFYMKSDYDAENLKNAGAAGSKIDVIGNLKFVGVPGDIRPIEIDRKPVIVAGSVRTKEFRRVIEGFTRTREKYHDAVLVIAPRHLNTVPRLVQELESAKLGYVLRSERESPGDAGAYIVDTMGELVAFYAACDIAFVGGTLSDYGGHNPLEPAYFGKPVLFGPHYRPNREAYETLLESGGGRIVRNGTELATAFTELLENDEMRRKMGLAARETVEKMRNVSEKYRLALTEFLHGL